MGSTPANPAFPYVLQDGWGEYCRGITVREYFAARAPAEPAEWFVPIMVEAKPEVPPGRMPYNINNEREAQAYAAKYHAAKAAFDTWEMEQRKQRLIQWPWAWADAVLAAAGAKASPTDAEALEVAVMLLESAYNIVGSVDQERSGEVGQPAPPMFHGQTPQWRAAASNWFEALITFRKRRGKA